LTKGFNAEDFVNVRFAEKTAINRHLLGSVRAESCDFFSTVWRDIYNEIDTGLTV
jgi:hypothetical protein